MKLRAAALALAALVLAGALSACGGEEQVIYEEEVRAVNNGEPAELVVELPEEEDAAFEAALQEIAERYEADYPNTKIRFESAAGRGHEESASRDILAVSSASKENAGLPLADLADYADFWESEGSLTAGASAAMHYMGAGTLYAVPYDFQQNLLFYRRDWFQAFNDAKNDRGLDKTDLEKARTVNWKRLLEVPEKLGDKGRLAISRDLQEYVFNTILWSDAGPEGIADTAAPYYAPGEECKSLFANEWALETAERFRLVYNASIEEGNLRQEEAIQAFIQGEAAVLIAEASAAKRLLDEMEEGSWGGVGLPAGVSGTSIVPFEWKGWGVNRDSRELEKAIHFLCYLTNADNNTHLAAACGVLPIYKEAEVMEPSLAHSHRFPEIELLNQSGYRYSGEPYLCFDFSGNLYGNTLDELLEETITAEEFLQKADEACQKAYQQVLDSGSEIPWLKEEEKE